MSTGLFCPCLGLTATQIGCNFPELLQRRFQVRDNLSGQNIRVGEIFGIRQQIVFEPEDIEADFVAGGDFVVGVGALTAIRSRSPSHPNPFALSPSKGERNPACSSSPLSSSSPHASSGDPEFINAVTTQNSASLLPRQQRQDQSLHRRPSRREKEFSHLHPQRLCDLFEVVEHRHSLSGCGGQHLFRCQPGRMGKRT